MEQKLNIIKNDLKLDIIDLNILKLLLNNYNSKYSLWKEYQKIDPKIIHAKISRRINKMKNYNLISLEEGLKKGGVKDKRGTERISLKEYGIANIIIKCEKLTDREMDLILEKAYQNEPYKVDYFSLYIDESTKTLINYIMDFLKIRINLEYFNLDYFKNQLKLALIVSYTDFIKQFIANGDYKNWKFNKKEIKKIRNMKDHYANENILFLDDSIDFLDRKIKLYEEGRSILKNVRATMDQLLKI